MPKIGIIAAMEEEIRVLAESMIHVHKVEIAGMTFMEGFCKNKEVVIVQSGIGKVNAAIAAVCLLQDFQCEALINTGSAGGIGKGLSIGDVVFSTELSYFDADARVFGYQLGQIPQMPLFYKASLELREAAVEAAHKVGLTTKEGLIVTGDSFVSGGSVMEDIHTHFPDALVVEMEGAAVAQTSWRFDVPFLIVRAVSDTADSNAAISFDAFIIEAGKRSAEMVLELLTSL